ncbi:MAG: hypothetical protein KGL15_04125 [Acidobacteriota bacterium]|nr:hypothetical protein [Acidobacteriota bacterium]
MLAGCGAATRVDFAGHKRPASAVEVSVLASPSGLTLEPSRLRPGLVVFDITNQTAHAARYTVRAHGRAVARTPFIAPGQAAQLKATLSGPGETFSSFSHTSPRRTLADTVDLVVSGRARDGGAELTQP